MDYWLNLFTGTTWAEFQAAGGTTSGFREHNWTRARSIKPGDLFLCYLVGVKRWVGLLQVTGPRFKDDSPIYAEEVFPVRFPVKPLALLPPEHGVPMEEFEGKLTFYLPGGATRSWSGHVRSSPTKYDSRDGLVIADAIRKAKQDPVLRPVDTKKLERSANLYKLKSKAGDQEIETVVRVPQAEEEDEALTVIETTETGPTHTEIQARLLHLGAQMGLRVWAPKADRSKVSNCKLTGGSPALLESLPHQFDPATNRTIENIDVLWLSGQAIVAAFEVEHTTAIYSGLLRMSDLLTMQPNLDIKLYLVAPDERITKFEAEVARPTFSSRVKPLYSMCRFLPYSKLCDRLQEAKSVIRFLKPEFLDEIAELYDPAEELGD